MKTIAERLRTCGPLRRMVVSINAALDRSVEQKLNIDTVSLNIPVDQASKLSSLHEDGLRYETLPYWLVQYCLRQLVISRDDVMFDIGCGLGGWVCLFSLRPIRKCVGVEICEDFVSIAKRNANLMKGRRAPIEFLIQDAATVDYKEGTIFLFFNPFGVKTMRLVLDRIRASLELRPRRVVLAYINPVHEDVFQSSGWLKCFSRNRVPGFTRARASLWSNDI